MTNIHSRLAVCLALALACSAAAIVARNSTLYINVPDGATIRGALLCKPTKWTTIAAFFLGNYIAHVATVRNYSGEELYYAVVICIGSLGFPCYGVTNSLDALFRCARIRGRASPLQTAAHAGALCMVVRSPDWKPIAGERIVAGIILPALSPQITTRADQISEKGEQSVRLLEGFSSRSSHSGSDSGSDTFSNFSNSDASDYSDVKVYSAPCLLDFGRFWGYSHVDLSGNACNRIIHGSAINLPDGYEWAFVPRHARVCSIIPGQKTEISSSYNTVKAIAALLHTIYALVTLYHTRGDQITRYGYASFGLTVAPYAVMSLLNLLGILVTPDYPMLYMVHSDIMEEAETRGGRFEGVVGTLRASSEPFVGPKQYTGILSGEERAQYAFTAIGRGATHHLRLPTATYSRHSTTQERSQPIALPHHEDFFSSENVIYVPNHPNFERTESGSSFDASTSNGLGHDNPPRAYHFRAFLVYALISCIPLAIVGGLSGFRAGQSTMSQRVWTMLWLAIGTYPGLIFVLMPKSFGLGDIVFKVWVMAFLLTPVIGGFVIVGKMLKEFGDCITLD